MRNILSYNPSSNRNKRERLLTFTAGLFTLISILPLVLVLTYVVIKGGSEINLNTLILEPEPPGDDLIGAGGMGPALVGTFVMTLFASIISIPIGIGSGIYLAEYSKGGLFSTIIRFGTTVLAGVPSIIAGVFVYAVIVSSKIIFGSTFSAIAGGIALSILMLPSIIKTTEEGLKLVSDDLRKGALGIGASVSTMITNITLPASISTISTGIVLGIARAAGETAPLIFTALFSRYYISSFEDVFSEMASLSVLIYNFALEPYQAQNKLAWAASLILVILVLTINIAAKLVSRYTTRMK